MIVQMRPGKVFSMDDRFTRRREDAKKLAKRLSFATFA
jgi:rRNA maturation protein Nop10